MVLYLIRNKVTGREYVGVTRRTLKARWSDHLSGAFGKHLKTPLYGDMREFGRASFECVLLDETDDHDVLMDMERTAIANRGTLFPDGYNLAKGGRVNFGWRHSEASKQHFSRIRKGLKASDETRKRMSEAKKGRVFSEQTRKRMSAWQIGRVMSDESKAKMRAAKLGKTWTAARRQALANVPPRSQESRQKTSERSLAYWASLSPDQRKGHNQKRLVKED